LVYTINKGYTMISQNEYTLYNRHKKMQNKMQPNFLCVGTQKAGTTTLHDILKQHPDIYLPESKEAHFFDIDDHFRRGIDWWQETFFSTIKNETAIGAMTPEYLYYSEVPSRILKTLGADIKIIIILRNPIARAYSHYLMSRRRGYEDHSFSKAIEIESERIKKGEFEKNHYSYISRSLYFNQVKRYVDTFPKENILIIKFEDDFLNKKEETIASVLDFLDVKRSPLTTNLKSNKATKPKSIAISKLISHDGKIKTFLRFFIRSSKVKIKINETINNLNQTTKHIPKLKREESKYYLNKLFLDDIKSLEKFLNINLESWYK